MIETYYMVDSLCILFLVAIIIGEITTSFRDKSQLNFFIMLGLMIALFLTEIVGTTMISGDISRNETEYWIIYLTYYSLLLVVVALWVQYCNIQIGLDYKYSQISKLLYLILLMVILTTPFTGLFAKLDGSKWFVNGDLYFPVLILTVMPAIIVSALAVMASLRSRDAGSRMQYATLAAVLIPLLILFFVELYLVSMPLLSIGLVVSSLSVYFVMKKQMIVIDKLTGIINKNAIQRIVSRLMDKYDTKEARNPNPVSKMIYDITDLNIPLPNIPAFTEKKHLYLAMMDMNHFKSINDNYGHAEGDVALRDFAHILTDSCKDTGFIPGRYAGDEFVLFGECDDLSELEAVIDRIHKGCEAKKKPYEFGTSIGYAEYSPEYRTFKSFLKVADEMMIKVKEASRKKN